MFFFCSVKNILYNLKKFFAHYIKKLLCNEMFPGMLKVLHGTRHIFKKAELMYCLSVRYLCGYLNTGLIVCTCVRLQRFSVLIVEEAHLKRRSELFQAQSQYLPTLPSRNAFSSLLGDKVLALTSILLPLLGI